jgi:hypothetical protein
MTDPVIPTRTASVEWVFRSLCVELHRESADSLRDRAETLVAIAEHHQRPIEELVQWIHCPAPRKEWSAAEFRSYCERAK